MGSKMSILKPSSQIPMDNPFLRRLFRPSPYAEA